MLRVFLALVLFLSSVVACQCKEGHRLCLKKVKDSNSISNSKLQVPIAKHKRVVFCTTKPSGKILKHDPYLGLYLIEDKKGFLYPFKIDKKTPKRLWAVNNKMVISGKIIKKQVGLNNFATFSKPLFYPSVVVDSCCDLEGIVTPKGIIQKDYIERFVKSNRVEYGDIGIRTRDKKGCIEVESYNPFLKNNPFRVGDCVVKYDGKKVLDASALMKDILFSKIGSTHKVVVKRGSKIIALDNITTKKRRGGGYLSDTFLEVLGISFDKDLYITDISQDARKYQLKLGDRLLEVNYKAVTNEEDILKSISQSKKHTYLLFERDNFEFFIKVN